MTSPTVLDYLDDPDLLGSHYQGPSWDRWRSVLRAAFALPMSERDLELFAEVAGDRSPPTAPVRELVCAIGRGGGKNAVAAGLATWIAATGDFTRLTVGERAVILLLAIDRDTAAIALDMIRGRFEASPALAGLIERIGEDTIDLRNRARITVTTNSIRAPRGRTVAAAIYDEVAFWRSVDFANPDVEVDLAVSPGLARFPGSLKILISSVYRRGGLLYERYCESFGKDDPDRLVVLGGTLQFNPTHDPKPIERDLARDPVRFGAEYNCEWRDDVSGFLDRELLKGAIDPAVSARPPKPGVRYRAFCDPSGGRRDSFTAVIVHAEGQLVVIDLIFERRAPFSPFEVVTDIVALLRQYGIREITGDNYAASWTVESFQRHGIAYRLPSATAADEMTKRINRSEIYLTALPFFVAGRVRLPENERLIHQLVSLERKPRAGGRDVVDHPREGADDLANAVAGAIVLAGAVEMNTWVLLSDAQRETEAKAKEAAKVRAAARQVAEVAQAERIAEVTGLPPEQVHALRRPARFATRRQWNEWILNAQANGAAALLTREDLAELKRLDEQRRTVSAARVQYRFERDAHNTIEKALAQQAAVRRRYRQW